MPRLIDKHAVSSECVTDSLATKYSHMLWAVCPKNSWLRFSQKPTIGACWLSERHIIRVAYSTAKSLAASILFLFASAIKKVVWSLSGLASLVPQ
jgi:hypothetical protein